MTISQQTQNFFILFVQRRPNVFDAVQILYTYFVFTGYPQSGRRSANCAVVSKPNTHDKHTNIEYTGTDNEIIITALCSLWVLQNCQLLKYTGTALTWLMCAGLGSVYNLGHNE